MDLEETKEMLGQRGQLGAALLVLGLFVIGKHDRKAAVGTTLVVVGMGLVAGGIVDSALEKMGMKGAF
ncbi:hypothetical protein N0B31_12005 [Salinirubellus salinus]|jgi:hypothetical protein|uniref:Uncharacterized protein n=1 Tax=Salinirubellus salinus TaxID=1364945 RepID=A0A9E7QZF9_9EURY|nr:hypothetical protein [Salinirubellus salinus]UWM52871.1 hypothetical protein N0B31_12005 [Salinirubellus salinus]